MRPSRDAGAYTVRPVQFRDETSPKPRAPRGTSPSLRPGERLYVRDGVSPPWVQTTITAVRHTTVEVQPDAE